MGTLTQYKERGFTLIELIVTLGLLGVLLSLGRMGLTWQFRYSNYIRCEECARTIFLAMQSALADLEAQGELEETFETLTGGDAGPALLSKVPEEVSSYLAGSVEKNLYYIYISGETYDTYLAGESTFAEKWLYRQLTRQMADTSILKKTEGPFASNAQVIVELDAVSQTVFSVFYASWAEELTYSCMPCKDPYGSVSVNSEVGNEKNTMKSRSHEVRKKLCLGCYSIGETTPVAHLTETTGNG